VQRDALLLQGFAAHLSTFSAEIEVAAPMATVIRVMAVMAVMVVPTRHKAVFFFPSESIPVVFIFILFCSICDPVYFFEVIPAGFEQVGASVSACDHIR
jgi:hypothetical protein